MSQLHTVSRLANCHAFNTSRSLFLLPGVDKALRLPWKLRVASSAGAEATMIQKHAVLQTSVRTTIRHGDDSALQSSHQVLNFVINTRQYHAARLLLLHFIDLYDESATCELYSAYQGSKLTPVLEQSRLPWTHQDIPVLDRTDLDSIQYGFVTFFINLAIRESDTN
jgi:hypothetical protein